MPHFLCPKPRTAGILVETSQKMGKLQFSHPLRRVRELWYNVHAKGFNQMCNYKAIIHHDDGQYWAEFPAFPGCYTSGMTLEEVKSNLSKVLRFHIAGLNEMDCDDSDLAEVAEVAI